MFRRRARVRTSSVSNRDKINEAAMAMIGELMYVGMRIQLKIIPNRMSYLFKMRLLDSLKSNLKLAGIKDSNCRVNSALIWTRAIIVVNDGFENPIERHFRLEADQRGDLRDVRDAARHVFKALLVGFIVRDKNDFGF